MDFIQRLIHYFAVVRRQMRRHRRLVVTCAAVVVFATTYALILPAITLDENDATEQSGINLDPASVTTLTYDSETDGDEGDGTTEGDASADAYTVTAEVPAEANLPEGTALKVKEIKANSTDGKDDEAYAAYSQKALDALATDSAEVSGLAQARFFDISFVDANGNEVEPSADVKVAVNFGTAPTVASTDAVRVIHVDDDGNATPVATDKTEVEASDDNSNAVGKVTFEASQFSVYGLVEVASVQDQAALNQAAETGKSELGDDSVETDQSDSKANSDATVTTQQTITAESSDGASVEITGNLPEGATATIAPVTLSDDELDAYLGSSASEAIDAKVVYDISIMVNGQEWEPDDSVSVVVHNPVLSATDGTTAAEGSTVAVSHLADGDNKTAERVDAESADGAVSFSTDSFSLYALYTYTVDFYYGDAEWHLAGGTSTTLSALFQNLAMDTSVSDVTGVEFSDPTLLSVEQDDGDWTLTSLLPFDTDGTLTVTLADGSTIEITTKDVKYPKYTYKTYSGGIEDVSSSISPYVGSFSYTGKYDIFGGGNGLPGTTTQKASDFMRGKWGYQWASTDRWNNLKGKAVGVDQNGDSLVGETGKFKSGSRGSITWNGSVEKAFLSFGYLRSSASNHGQLEVNVYGPDKNLAATITISLDNSSYAEDTERSSGDYITQTNSWRYLTFDATSLVSRLGSGTYTVIVTASGAKSGGSGTSAYNDFVGDMGWSIYGVSYDSSRSGDVAIAGLVGEEEITANDYKQKDGTYLYKDAVASFSQSFASNGTGKVWFNVHGGETAHHVDPKNYGSGNSYATDFPNGRDEDVDYLEIITSDGGVNNYLKLGGDDGSDVKVSDSSWKHADIASPNNNQTAPNANEKYQNSFAFGLSSYSGLSSSSVTGVRKRMDMGTDVFGSVMLLTEIQPGSGNPSISKTIEVKGSSSLPASVAEADRTFTFSITGKNGAPLPKGSDGDAQSSVNVVVPASSGSETTVTTGLGNFTFPTTTNEATYVYEVKETGGAASGWSYDTRTLTLTFTVKNINNVNQVTYKWTDASGKEIAGNGTFTNTYTATGSVSFTKKGRAADGTTSGLSGATFGLYTDQDCTNALAGSDGNAITATSNQNGTVTFSDIPVGSYYMKETSAPSGYQTSTTVYGVTISATDGQSKITGENNSNVTEIVDESVVANVTIKKTDADGTTTLSGAEFKLTVKGKSTAATAQSGLDQGKVTIGDTGTATITGLPVGDYTLTETKAPDGYVVLTAGIDFSVSADGTVTLADGTDASKATISGTKDAVFTLTVKNTPGKALPETGGSGALPYLLAGGGLITTAIIGYALRRKGEGGETD